MDANAFEPERARLAAIATRILTSSADVDDVLQEAHLRFVRADGVDDPPAWLTTVVTRLCLDQLRKRRTGSHNEAAQVDEKPTPDPEADALLAEQVSGAMRAVIDSLAPAERVVFVLHDVFGYPFDDIAEFLGRSNTAVRQMASRARRKVRNPAEPFVAVADTRVVDAFLTAARGGELAVLLTLLAPDVVMRADRAGQQLGTPAMFTGPAVAERFNGSKGAVPVTVDGERGAAWIVAGTVKVVFVFHVVDALISEIELIAEPDVLATLEVVRP